MAVEQLKSESAHEALFKGEVDGVVALTFANERPLAGLAGWLDWRLHGQLSESLRRGITTGAVGECVYLPVKLPAFEGRAFHVVLAGAGFVDSPGARGEVPEETLAVLRKNLASLKISRLAISRADFAGADDKFFEKNLKGVQLWISP